MLLLYLLSLDYIRQLRERRIKFFAPADYSENTELEQLVKSIIDRTITNEKLENIYYNQKREQVRNDREQGEAKRNRVDLITELDNSHSYATTHAVIAKLQSILDWENEEREDLFRIGMENSQVLGVLNDTDVKVFYKKLIGESKALSDNAKKIKEIIEE